MKKQSFFNAFALANTFAAIDIVLHPIFHLWVYVSPNSYEWMMNLFVAGLHLEVNNFDVSIGHIIIGTFVEVSAFWVLGFVGASVYNFFIVRMKNN